MRTYRIASIPADGIGPEVIAAGLEALDAVAARDGGFQLEVEHLDWGSERYRREGALMPADGLDRPRAKDAIPFGGGGGRAAGQGGGPVRGGGGARHPGPRHAGGPAAADLPGVRPIRQRAPDA